MWKFALITLVALFIIGAGEHPLVGIAMMIFGATERICESREALAKVSA